MEQKDKGTEVQGTGNAVIVNAQKGKVINVMRTNYKYYFTNNLLPFPVGNSEEFIVLVFADFETFGGTIRTRLLFKQSDVDYSEEWVKKQIEYYTCSAKDCGVKVDWIDSDTWLSDSDGFNIGE